MKNGIPNLDASVKQRLLNHARTNQEDFNLLQVRYATERLLYRLSISEHKEAFFLKGAMLFVLWENQPHRPTRDMDLLFIQQRDARELEEIFREVASLDTMPDGLKFNPATVKASEIREDNAYGGIRVTLTALLGTGRIPVQIDIGLGDAVYPQPKWTELSSLLDFPSPRIRPYPVYTVVAEKYQCMVQLAEANSRMKDYYDIHYLLRKFYFNGHELQEAMRQTFARRNTEIPESLPVGLSSDFSENPQKQIQWNAFLRKNGLQNIGTLAEVVESIAEFLMPVAMNADIPKKTWSPKGGWN